MWSEQCYCLTVASYPWSHVSQYRLRKVTSSPFHIVFQPLFNSLQPCINASTKRPESTVRKNIKMQGPSFRTALTDGNADKEKKSAWPKLLNRKGSEDEIERRHHKMGQTETPTTAEKKSHADNVLQSYTIFE